MTHSVIERRTFDVDIDVNTSCKREQYGVRSMIYNEETQRILPHPSGVYLEDVPVDSVTNNCAFDYKYGDSLGFMKVDILTNKSYDRFRTKEELTKFSEMTPDWNKLLDENIVSRLPHIANHYDVITKIQPNSIEELADVIALIRPAKINLIPLYRGKTISVRKRLYSRPLDGTAYFKKSHAIAYAVMIVAVLNKIINPTGIQW
ncbi:hypothetical protein [Alishewanella phage vB_AspM_Slickus01]|nr:hypothetical protein [Alishewanella phage vB_AspM_Slicko01]WGH49824.1 hypothetical protein [Alishewanella phage vB_AspM_Slickus01]